MTNKNHNAPKFSQGVCHDGAAILKDGRPLTIEQILTMLRRGAEAERIVGEIVDSLYGQNISLQNWHMNGALEPIDNLFEYNEWFNETIEETGYE